MPVAPLREIHVAAAVLQDDRGRVLVARRPESKPMAGALEFPGGKIGAQETRLEGLRRELREELEIDLISVRYLGRFTHDYPEMRVHLFFWKALEWKGTPVGAEGQQLLWLEPSALMGAGLLPANEPVVGLLLSATNVNAYGWFRSAR